MPQRINGCQFSLLVVKLRRAPCWQQFDSSQAYRKNATATTPITSQHYVSECHQGIDSIRRYFKVFKVCKMKVKFSLARNERRELVVSITVEFIFHRQHNTIFTSQQLWFWVTMQLYAKHTFIKVHSSCLREREFVFFYGSAMRLVWVMNSLAAYISYKTACSGYPPANK